MCGGEHFGGKGLEAVAGGEVPASIVSETEHAISFLDALFTSTSAVCVTGLIVVDTPNQFSGVGQVVLMLLIQFGIGATNDWADAPTDAVVRRAKAESEPSSGSTPSQESPRISRATARARS